MPKGMDFPLISYDYNAPLGEFGETRPAYFALRPLHQFLLNYSDLLANTKCVDQAIKEKNSDDPYLRVMARSNNNRGFLFTSYYGNVNPFPTRDVKLNVTTTNGNISLPSNGKINITNGHNFIFPYNLLLANTINLISATAQPTSIINTANVENRFFISPNDQEAEFVFSANKIKKITYDGQVVSSKNGMIICNIKPDKNKVISIVGNNDKVVNIVLINNYDAEHSMEANFNGQKCLLISDNDMVNTNNVLTLTKCSKNVLSFLSFPQLKSASFNSKIVNATSKGLFFEYSAIVAPVKIQPDLQNINAIKSLIKIPTTQFEGINDIYVTISFEGMVCRVFDISQGELVADKLKGPWRISLRRFKNQLSGEGLLVRASPGDSTGKDKLSSDGMTLENITKGGSGAKINSINFEPEYKAEIIIK